LIYEINVTQEDINNGGKKQCTMCPIALATKRTFPNAIWISVTQAYIRVVNAGDGERGTEYLSPLGVEQFINDFDRGRPVSPFSFTVNSDNLF
jgi:hypothetical protein